MGAVVADKVGERWTVHGKEIVGYCARGLALSASRKRLFSVDLAFGKTLEERSLERRRGEESLWAELPVVTSHYNQG